MKNVLDVAKLLNSCGFASCLILLQKLLSLFATWLEPISKYRNASCNNLNELTIFFSVSPFLDYVFLLESSLVWYLTCSNFRFENITISLTIFVWNLAIWSCKLTFSCVFVWIAFFALKSVPFVFDFKILVDMFVCFLNINKIFCSFNKYINILLKSFLIFLWTTGSVFTYQLNNPVFF